MKPDPSNTPAESLTNAVIVLAIAGIVLLKLFFVYMPPGPILWDEWLYKTNAELIFTGRHFFSAHYPPLYSLTISIALFFSNLYENIQLVNGILSALLIVPVWLIAGMFVSRQNALPAALLAIMLPFQVIYPGLVMSENLFLPVFTFAVYFALQGAGTTIWKAGLFGFFLGLGYLTKYLMLPAIPVLVLFWILVPVISEPGTPREPLKSGTFRRNCLVLSLAFMLAMIPWMVLARKSGFSLPDALGFSVAGNSVFRKVSFFSLFTRDNLGNILMWIGANTAYMVLSTAMFSALVLAALPVMNHLRKTDRSSRHLLLFLALLLTLTVAYVLLSAQHSFRVKYNYPFPVRLMGRYLMPLMPLYVAAGVAALDRMFMYKNFIKKKKVIAAVTAMLLLVVLSRWILFGKGLWGLPPTLASNYLDAPDSLVYRFPLLFCFILLLLVLLGIFIARLPREDAARMVPLRYVIPGVLIFWQLTVFSVAILRAHDNFSGVHARKIAAVLINDTAGNGKTPLYYHVRYVWPAYWTGAPRFWGIPQREYIPAKGKIAVSDTVESIFLLTEDSLPFSPLVAYPFHGEHCYLYRIGREDVARLPAFKKFR